ncbi:MAG TPA: cobalamin-independent methionine synthase II family protein [Stellaceae bacterium]|nr:cobalamin-independent methionine synthase II family protein [Stellaceae bacterium]
MTRIANRIPVSHVGSLVRPPALTQFLQKAQNDEPYDKAAFEACLTQSVVEAVRLQAEAGVDIVSDGEYGKSVNWAFYVHRRLAGLERRALTPEEAKDPMIAVISGRDREAFPEFYGEYDARVLRNAAAVGRPVVTGPIRYTGQAELQHDIANLKAGLAKAPGVTGFLPVVAPASALPNAKNEHYRDEETYLFALAEALGVEYRAIIDAGLELQVDDAFLPYMFEKMVPPMSLAQYRKWAELRIAALNHALKGLPKEKTRYHICWGSWNGPHMFDVPLKDIVDIVLKVEVGGYSFEAANPRHEHEWQVWKSVKLPPGTYLMPGVVTHSTNIVEHPELVAERLLRFAGIVGRDNVMAGTDCGFSQSPLAGRVHRTIMWAKLKSLAEGAKLATAQLWR